MSSELVFVNLSVATQIRAAKRAVLVSLMSVGMSASLVMAMTSSVHAATTSEQHELRVQICSLATAGIKTAATERQAGKSKTATKQHLDRDLQSLRRQIKDEAFVNRIANTWYRALDQVYQDPMLSSDEEKAVYISTITADAIVSCLSNV